MPNKEVVYTHSIHIYYATKQSIVGTYLIGSQESSSIGSMQVQDFEPYNSFESLLGLGNLEIPSLPYQQKITEVASVQLSPVDTSLCELLRIFTLFDLPLTASLFCVELYFPWLQIYFSGQKQILWVNYFS